MTWRYRWWIGGLIFASTVINYLDRQTLCVLAPHLKTEFGWSTESFAWSVISFRLAYAVMQAGYICSAGGRVKTRDANFSPQPMTDCPVIPDPFSSRQGPTNFTCNYMEKVVNGESATFLPASIAAASLLPMRLRSRSHRASSSSRMARSLWTEGPVSREPTSRST